MLLNSKINRWCYMLVKYSIVCLFFPQNKKFKLIKIISDSVAWNIATMVLGYQASSSHNCYSWSKFFHRYIDWSVIMLRLFSMNVFCCCWNRALKRVYAHIRCMRVLVAAIAMWGGSSDSSNVVCLYRCLSLCERAYTHIHCLENKRRHSENKVLLKSRSEVCKTKIYFYFFSNKLQWQFKSII